MVKKPLSSFVVTSLVMGVTLKLLEWERYDSIRQEMKEQNLVAPGEPYTMWIKYRMALQAGDKILYESQKVTTLIMEDIGRLIEGLEQVAAGKTKRLGFDPLEPDFGLAAKEVTESEASVAVSSAAETGAGAPTGAVN